MVCNFKFLLMTLSPMYYKVIINLLGVMFFVLIGTCVLYPTHSYENYTNIKLDFNMIKMKII